MTMVPVKKIPTTCQSFNPHSSRSAVGSKVADTSAGDGNVFTFVCTLGINALFCPLQWNSSCNRLGFINLLIKAQLNQYKSSSFLKFSKLW